MIDLVHLHYGSKYGSLAIRLWYPRRGGPSIFIVQRRSDKKIYIYDAPMANNPPLLGPFKSLRLAVVALELLL